MSDSGATSRLLRFIAPLFVLLIAISTLGTYIFFPHVFQAATKYVFDGASGSKDLIRKDRIRIGLSQDPQSLEPTSLDVTTRTLAFQVYEPLVRMNRFLQAQPALAVSWGRLSPTVWRFYLRENVSFHNHRGFVPQDVAASFHRAQNYDRSDLRGILRGIDVRVVDGHTIDIVTKKPEPALLQKVSGILILPAENEKKNTFVPIGTGPYIFEETKRGVSYSFSSFAEYWGVAPTYAHVDTLFYPKGEDRVQALQGGDIDLIVNVPPGRVESLQSDGFFVDALPSLEVNFLLFDQKGILKNTALRQAVSFAIDKKQFETLASGYATSVSQFVSSGVFGFDPKLHDVAFDVEKAKGLVSAYSSFEKVPLRIKLPDGAEAAGEYLITALRAVGFDPQARYIPWNTFQQTLQAHDSDMYFFGWKSDMGSAADFYINAVHSYNLDANVGLFNAGGFRNTAMDSAIDTAIHVLDTRKRLGAYQDIMRKLVEGGSFGIPLFESQVLYASSSHIQFAPRIDGLIFAADIR